MPIKLLAAVPTHSGTIVVEGVKTIVEAQQTVLSRGGRFELHYEFGATVSLVRNAIVAHFLQGDADYLLMLDADQGAGPTALERMLDFNKPIVGCIYPRRAFDWDRVRLKQAPDVDHVLEQASGFVGWLDGDEQGNVAVENGFAKATHVGAGMLLVRRDAIETMMAHYPELAGRGFGPDAYPRYNETGRWGFFNPLETAEGVPLSEDISFCNRWRQAGGEIWANIANTFVHVGRYEFIGNYLEYLTKEAASQG